MGTLSLIEKARHLPDYGLLVLFLSIWVTVLVWAYLGVLGMAGSRAERRIVINIQFSLLIKY